MAAADSTLVSSLKEFYSVEQIRGFWQQATKALIGRATEPIQITGFSFAGETSTGVVIGTAEEARSFIASCQQAIALLNGETGVNPDQLARHLNFGGKPVMV